MNGASRFSDSHVVVTGSTKGIGAEIARRFGAEGANVIVTGRTRDAGLGVVDDITRGDGEATYIRTDVREPEQISHLVERSVSEYGSIDILVNNAAVQTSTSVKEAGLRDWEQVLETDFRAYWLCVKAVEPEMGNGCIINISSNHAFLTMPSHFPYNAVKAGINGMTRAMALDLGPDVRVNTINPGWIAVDRTLADLDEADLAHLESIHPVGRIGNPEDVAGVAAFLASDDAEYMTGASVVVDGGRSAVMQDDVLPDYRLQDESG